jgi:hypothetical protein
MKLGCLKLKIDSLPLPKSLREYVNLNTMKTSIKKYLIPDLLKEFHSIHEGDYSEHFCR